MQKGHSEIGILGAGIMGCCLALELAQRGYRVDLIDLASSPMTGASLHNEGKLHLGFVYANDPSKETHGLMIRGSLFFSRIIEKLTRHNTDSLMSSRPFYYFVPTDSQLDMEALKKHFFDVDATIRRTTQTTGDHYLNRRYDRYYEQNSSADHARMFSPDMTLGSVKTEERAVSPIALANILVQAIKEQPNISFVGNTKVMAASRLACGSVEIELLHNGKSSLKKYACVSNCLWDDKLRVDHTAGIVDNGPWLLRYKATINISAPAAINSNIPSATGILGSYGDIVNHDNGSYYVSWYPLCKILQSREEDGRKLHNLVHKGMLSRCIRKIVLRAYIPSMAGLLSNKNHYVVGGGVILARGATDIDDPTSYLHQRSSIGPVAHGSYITIDTGKYCTAPLFALEAADMITDIL
jgi:hypothetical protein